MLIKIAFLLIAQKIVLKMEGKSIFAYDNKCKVADAYRNLTKEVLEIAAREKARFRNDGSR